MTFYITYSVKIVDNACILCNILHLLILHYLEHRISENIPLFTSYVITSELETHSFRSFVTH